MDDSQLHTMQPGQVQSSDFEEWCCPTCGRQILVSWSPTYSKIVLHPGDAHACHTGGSWGARVMSPMMTASDGAPVMDDLAVADDENASDVSIESDALRPWLKWIRKAGLEM